MPIKKEKMERDFKLKFSFNQNDSGFYILVHWQMQFLKI